MLLQATAPGFFVIIQLTLVESILMRVIRLMDPATTNNNNDNCSLQGLKKALPQDMGGLRNSIDSLFNQYKDDPFKTLKAVRNKALGHNDLTKRDALAPNQLWINFTDEDYKNVQQLAGAL